MQRELTVINYFNLINDASKCKHVSYSLIFNINETFAIRRGGGRVKRMNKVHPVRKFHDLVIPATTNSIASLRFS